MSGPTRSHLLRTSASGTAAGRLDPALTPSRLIDPHERRAVVIAEPMPPPRSRTLQVLARFLRLGVGVLGLLLTGRLTVEEYARRLRDAFEEIGGLWLKAGQLLSLRIDVYPLALCRELQLMQERVVGFPGTVARGIIEADLGRPLESLFDEFEDTPFAAVPMGQVHRARLKREGTWVAIKVQQPYCAELFAGDLRLMRWVVRLFALLGFHERVRWDEGLAELEQLAREDLDFRFEASAMRRMRRTLRRHGIYVPQVFRAYCGPHVLVSEFVHAVLMADYIKVEQRDPARLAAWRLENDIDPRRIARRLFGSLLRQLLEDNLYHGDQRPGNIVLLRHNRIALIDFRMTHFTEGEYLQKYRLFVRALATRDYSKAADLAFMLCAVLPVIDIEEVKEEVIHALRSWATRTLVRDLPYDERSLDGATAEIVAVLHRHRCTMKWGWLRIHRAMATLDHSLARLDPRLNHPKQALRYFERAHRRSLREFAGRQFLARAVGSVKTAMEIQDRINEYTMYQGSLIRRHAQVFQGATNKFADTFATIIGALAAALVVPGLLLLALLIDQRVPRFVATWLGPQAAGLAEQLPRMGMLLGSAFLLLDVYVVVALQRLKHRLRQKDVRGHERVAQV